MSWLRKFDEWMDKSVLKQVSGDLRLKKKWVREDSLRVRRLKSGQYTEEVPSLFFGLFCVLAVAFVCFGLSLMNMNNQSNFWFLVVVGCIVSFFSYRFFKNEVEDLIYEARKK